MNLKFLFSFILSCLVMPGIVSAQIIKKFPPSPERKVPNYLPLESQIIKRAVTDGEASVRFENLGVKRKSSGLTEKITNENQGYHSKGDIMRIHSGKVSFTYVGESIDFSMWNRNVKSAIYPGNIVVRNELLNRFPQQTQADDNGRNPIQINGRTIQNPTKIQLSALVNQEVAKLKLRDKNSRHERFRGGGGPIVKKLKNIAEFEMFVNRAVPEKMGHLFPTTYLHSTALEAIFLFEQIDYAGTISANPPSKKIYSDDSRNNDKNLLYFKSVSYGNRTIWLVKAKFPDYPAWTYFDNVDWNSGKRIEVLRDRLRKTGATLELYEITPGTSIAVRKVASNMQGFEQYFNNPDAYLKDQIYPISCETASLVLDPLQLSATTNDITFMKMEAVRQSFRVQLTLEEVLNISKPSETYKLGYEVLLNNHFVYRYSKATRISEKGIGRANRCYSFYSYEKEGERGEVKWNNCKSDNAIFKKADNASGALKVNQTISTNIADYEFMKNMPTLKVELPFIMMYSTMPLGKDNLGKQVTSVDFNLNSFFKGIGSTAKFSIRGEAEGRIYEFRFRLDVAGSDLVEVDRSKTYIPGAWY